MIHVPGPYNRAAAALFHAYPAAVVGNTAALAVVDEPAAMLSIVADAPPEAVDPAAADPESPLLALAAVPAELVLT